MDKKYPAFTGLTWHRRRYYSFFVPKEWQPNEWPDGREGVIYTPSTDDPLTLLAVELRDLGLSVTEDDLDDLYAGFLSGIEELPEVEIDHHENWIRGSLIGLEAKYTFAENGERRKRWVRQFYDATRQITVTAQGASSEIYDYWLPMFFEAMMTTKIHDTLPKMPVDDFAL